MSRYVLNKLTVISGKGKLCVFRVNMEASGQESVELRQAIWPDVCWQKFFINQILASPCRGLSRSPVGKLRFYELLVAGITIILIECR
jgi:hypothetical protein